MLLEVSKTRSSKSLFPPSLASHPGCPFAVSVFITSLHENTKETGLVAIIEHQHKSRKLFHFFKIHHWVFGGNQIQC